MTTPDIPKAPTGLRRGGKELWTSIHAKHYVLRPDELRVLEDACHQADLIDEINRELRKQLRDGNFMVAGSMGQQVSNPLISEIRQHRATLTQMLAKLKLPDLPADPNANAGGEGQVRGEQQRGAANSRWQIAPEAPTG
ncbi:hypothetical protein [Mycobacteroides salmoniphilum]|uniref:hypothetical protein n=1 Tax=Mycobacteroides salmoniphilum TaxID=404941 RepID=UPI001065261B|nr:hypothetical protein [Mycobacteroides salmoniphilum]TDZ91160.1 hypothetical protein CCUG62472_04419 [Mycobacteroides salmoniphilum]